MTHSKELPISDKTLQRHFCSVLRVGCDRETACDYLRISPRALNSSLQTDAEFRQDVLQAEAAAEFNHLRIVHTASQEEQNWRASIWWLERRLPDHYARRGPDCLTPSQLRQVMDDVAEIVVGEVDDPATAQRLLHRLTQCTQQASDASLLQHILQPPTPQSDEEEQSEL